MMENHHQQQETLTRRDNNHPSMAEEHVLVNACQCIWHVIRLASPDIVDRNGTEEIDPLPFAEDVEDTYEFQQQKKSRIPPTTDIRQLLATLKQVSRCDQICHNEEFCRSLHGSGGIAAVLYMFARIIEASATNDWTVQSEALSILLRISTLHPNFESDFVEVFDGYSMVNEVLSGSSCIPSLSLFQAYFNHCVLETTKDAAVPPRHLHPIIDDGDQSKSLFTCSSVVVNNVGHFVPTMSTQSTSTQVTNHLSTKMHPKKLRSRHSNIRPSSSPRLLAVDNDDDDLSSISSSNDMSTSSSAKGRDDTTSQGSSSVSDSDDMRYRNKNRTVKKNPRNRKSTLTSQPVSQSSKVLFLRSPIALQNLYRGWRVWHRIPEVASAMYNSILALLDPEVNPTWSTYNLTQVRSKIDLLGEIISMLETSIFEGTGNGTVPTKPFFNACDVKTLCRIVRLIVGSPPDVESVCRLVDCLVFLQDSSKSYVCQSKRSMYFMKPMFLHETNLSSNLSNSLKSCKSAKEDSLKQDDSASKRKGQISSTSTTSTLDEWLLIKTTNEVHPDTMHTVIFAQLVDTLTEIIRDLGKKDTQQVIGTILKPSHFIIWSNSDNRLVRQSVMKCLLTCLGPAGHPDVNKKFVKDFLSTKSFHLMSSQFSQYKGSGEIFTLLLSFILDAKMVKADEGILQAPDVLCSSMELVDQDVWNKKNWVKMTTTQAAAFNIILTLVVGAADDDVILCQWMMECLSRVIYSIPPSTHVFKELMDMGIMNYLLNVLNRSLDSCCPTSLNSLSIGNSTDDQSNTKSMLRTLLDDDIIEKGVCQLLELLGQKLVRSSGGIFLEALDRSIDLFLFASLSSDLKDKKEIFRQALICLLKSGFEDIESKVSSTSTNSMTASMTLSRGTSVRDVMGAATAFSFDPQGMTTLGMMDFPRTLDSPPTTTETTPGTTPPSSTHQSRRVQPISLDGHGRTEEESSSKTGSLTKSELNLRRQHLIERSLEVVCLRDPGSKCCEEEKFFVRSLLHVLFLNSAFPSSPSDEADPSTGSTSSGRRWPFLILISQFRRFMREKLTSLLVYILSPLYPISERVQFALWMSQSFPVNFSSHLSIKQQQVMSNFSICILANCTIAEREVLKRCLCLKPTSLKTFGNAFSSRSSSTSSLCPEVCTTSGFTQDLEYQWLLSLKKSTDSMSNTLRTRVAAYYQPFDKLSDVIVESAMSVTQSFVEEQNLQRTKYFQFAKDFSTHVYMTQKKWKSLVQAMTHERHGFYDEIYFPKSWSLDPSEGPSRMRRKLKRCHLDINEKFFRPGHQDKSKVEPIQEPLKFIYESTNDLKETSILIDSIHSREQITLTMSCMLITPRVELKGELLLSSTCCHFVGRQNDHTNGNSVGNRPTDASRSSTVIQETWILSQVKEFLERRYQLQDVAIELFLENGNSFLLSFLTPMDRRKVVSHLTEGGVSQGAELKTLTTVTKMWRDRTITNFDYLMFLNKVAGRSFNDLMIYPVYPFVLSDYKSDFLDLMDPTIYRTFSKPMAIQKKEREKYYKDQYNYLLSELKRRQSQNDVTLDPVSCPVYHFGSHYSNSGIVLHFLVRLPPFTQMFLHYQDKNFDIPDRTFHSMSVSWNLASGDSTTDFKELIPEFFYLPEFLTNFERFDFGNRHNGISVDDVMLPNWSRKDPRLFVLINRQALESEYTTKNLKDWIDLIFGYKQSGKDAIDAVNVFHPATYYGLEVNKIEDDLKRTALVTMIRTFGQMPKQLFKHPHPQCSLSVLNGMANYSKTPVGSSGSTSSLNETATHVACVLGEVNGLKWGSYVGSPSEADPVVVFRTEKSTFRGRLIPLHTNDIFGLPRKSCLLVSFNAFRHRKAVNTTYVSSLAVVSWGHSDGQIRVRDRRGQTSTPFVTPTLVTATFCATLSSYEILLVAFSSGAIAVYSVHPPFDTRHEQDQPPSIPPLTWLLGHSSPVTCMALSREFRVGVTCDENGVVILWDLNNLVYVRTLSDHEGDSVRLVTMSPTLGDVAAVSYVKSSSRTNREKESRLSVTTINGCPIADFNLKKEITALTYSSSPEGVSVNVLVTGFSDGIIQLWSSWDLTPVRVLSDEGFNRPITSICFFLDNNYLVAVNSKGSLRIWGKRGSNFSQMANPVTIL